MNVYELMDLVFMGDMEAFMELASYYEPLFMLVFKQELSGYTYTTDQEWIQDCRKLLWDCIFRYRMDKDTSFSRFLERSVRNMSVDLIRQIHRKIYDQENSLLSVDGEIPTSKGSMPVTDICADAFNMEAHVMNRVEYDYVMEQLEPILSENDKTMLRMFSQGYRKSEISRILNVPYRAMDNLLRRCRKRLCVDSLAMD